MSLEDSPTLDDYEDGIPAKLADPGKNKKIARLVILFLLIGLLVLAGLNWLQSQEAGLLTGRGDLRGVVLDLNRQPIQAEVFLVGVDKTALSGPDGRFELKNVPAGAHTLVVAYQSSGQKYPCVVQPGAQVDLGTLLAPPPGKFSEE